MTKYIDENKKDLAELLSIINKFVILNQCNLKYLTGF